MAGLSGNYKLSKYPTLNTWTKGLAVHSRSVLVTYGLKRQLPVIGFGGLKLMDCRIVGSFQQTARVA
jgi:hypothetical protein